METGHVNSSQFLKAIENNIKAINALEIIQYELKQKAWFRGTSDKAVRYWLLGCAGLVFRIVTSITEEEAWNWCSPPMTQGDWEENFIKDKGLPEYCILNPIWLWMSSSNHNGWRWETM
ncbi:hypothetical protein BDZ91DRAFT_767788 [Kalaharituber pfeilii]|nr:hypothetical protein BDZ91DRAFT_767788 [Kalaharituber pfeilii]